MMKTSDAIALAALFVSALAAGYTFWASHQERRNRREEIKNVLQARRAKIMVSETRPRSRGYITSGVRYAVGLHNAGRAAAHGIAAELLDAQGGRLQEPTKVAFLPSGQTEHVEFEVDEQAARAVALRVEWRDEDGPQSERFTLEREPERESF